VSNRYDGVILCDPSANRIGTPEADQRFSCGPGFEKPLVGAAIGSAIMGGKSHRTSAPRQAADFVGSLRRCGYLEFCVNQRGKVTAQVTPDYPCAGRATPNRQDRA
jgi:hypothetical protein